MRSKNGIEWNRIKKFMQVDVDEICMCTNFGGCCFSGFRDIATFKEERERGWGMEEEEERKAFTFVFY